MSDHKVSRDYAFAVALGPVGRFIGGGRRSRDLWYGSRFLSEITRCVAKRLVTLEQKIQLVVPTKDRLEQSYFPNHEGPTICNKVFGFARDVTVEVVRKELAAARVEAQNFLVKQLEQLLEDGRCKQDGIVIQGRVEAEINAVKCGDFIEYYAVYTPVVLDDASALSRVMELLSACKNTRAFGAPVGLEGAPKSSLDPGRDSVLDEASLRTPHGKALLAARRRLGIEGQERLDGISVARRCSVFSEREGQTITLPKLPFPPLARVVLAPWLEGAKRTSGSRLEGLRGDLNHLWRDAPDTLCLFSSPCREPGECREPGKAETPPLFDFDPSLFLENGVETLLAALEPKRQVGQLFPSSASTTQGDSVSLSSIDGNTGAATTFLRERAHTVSELLHRVGTPLPYYVLLEADGDGIGALVGEGSDANRKALVRALYDFSDKSWKTVADNEGCAFYAGGDELIAYLPVDRAFDAANALIADFHNVLVSCQMAGRASLSVGLAIAHLKDDLRATRGEAKKALLHAKKLRRQRDSAHGWICVHELPRGGSVRVSEGEAPVGENGTVGGFGSDVSSWQQALADELLSTKTAHDLLALADQFQRREEQTVGMDLARALVLQKRQRSGASRRGGGEELVDELERRCTKWKGWGDVRSFANEVLLAERLNRVRAQRHRDERTNQVTGAK